MIICVLSIPDASACATCLCGDPTLSAYDAEKPFAGRMRFSLSHLARSETVC